MKKLFVSYSNCQGSGIIHFLKKTRMAEEYDFVQHNNWQILMLEKPLQALLDDAARADVFLYQPCKGYTCTDGTIVPPADLIPRPAGSRDISYAYQFNHGFFPFVKLGEGREGWITGNYWKQYGPKDIFLVQDYFSESKSFDCARRFIECLAEQARRENETDIKMVPWILQNYRKGRLFLTYNHPTSALFVELANCIIDRLPLNIDVIDDTAVNENEAGMNGVQPVHPAVVRELGLEYQPTDGATEYYHELLLQMMKELR